MKNTVMLLIFLILLSLYVGFFVPPIKHEIQHGVGYIGDNVKMYQFLGDTTTTTKEQAYHRLDSLAELYGGVWILHIKQFSIGR